MKVMAEKDLPEKSVLFGEGSESIVFKSGNYIIKVFLNYEHIGNKKEKIKLLNKSSMDGFILPKFLYRGNTRNVKGYVMDYVKTRDKDKTLSELCQDSDVPLSEKIPRVIEFERKMEIAHNNGIILGDTSFHNVLFDENNNMKIIDTDNYKIGGLDYDIALNYSSVYRSISNGNNPSDADKYSFTMCLLRNLCLGSDFNVIATFFPEQLLDYIDSCIELPKNLKISILNNLKKDSQKEYLGNKLYDLKSDLPFIKAKEKKGEFGWKR